MTPKAIDSLDQILDKLRYSFSQHEVPLDEEPRYFDEWVAKVKAEAKAALLKWRDEAVAAELKGLIDFRKNETSSTYTVIERIEDRIKELEGAE